MQTKTRGNTAQSASLFGFGISRFLLLVFLAFTALSVSSVWAADLCVDAIDGNCLATAPGTVDCGNVAVGYSTIGAAEAAAGSTDTINICAGSYAEAVSLTHTLYTTGLISGLTSFTTTNTSNLGAGITATGAINFGNAVTLTGAPATITTTDNAVTFSSTLNGGVALNTVTGTGATKFQGVVGGVTPLTSISTGVTEVGAAITTTSTVGFSGAVTLTGATSITTTNSAVTFSSTINGGQTLATTTGSGATKFQGVVGGVTPLTSISTGVTEVGAAITTTSTVGFSGAVTMTGASTITTTNSAVSFSSTINGAQTLAVNSGSGLLTLGAAIGGVTPLTSLSLTTTNAGGITQSGAWALGTLTLAAGAANDITLNNAGNDFDTVVITSGNNVAFTDADAVALGASTVSGTLGVTTNGAITQSGALAVASGTSTFAAGSGNDITLTNAANNFGTVVVTSGNNVAFTVTAASSIIFGASTISGTLGVTTTGGGAVSQSGALSVSGLTTFNVASPGDISLVSATNDFTSVTVTSARDVTLVDTNTFGTVTLTSARNVALTSAGTIALGASTITGTLDVTTTNTAITQSGALAVTSTTTLSSGSGTITLDNAGNNFATVAATSTNAAISITDTNAVVLGTVSSGTGAVTVVAGGAITQSGATTSSSASTSFTTTSGAITLTNAGNNFATIAVSATDAAISITDTNAVVLGTVSSGTGAVTVSAGGAITQSGATTSSGIANFAAGANDITLDAANEFGTVVITSGNNVAITDSNSVMLGTSTVSGTLGVISGGAIAQSGALAVTGVATFNAGPANSITINNAGNDFSSVVITAGNTVQVRDSNEISFGASAISGSFIVTTTNADVTQTGGVTVGGSASFSTGSGKVIFTSTANDFSSVGFSAITDDVAFTDANAVIIAASAIAGNLNLTTTNGAITQSADLVVTQLLNISTGTGDVTLSNGANDFTGLAITSYGNVVIVDGTAGLNLANSVVKSLNLSVPTSIALTGASNINTTIINTDGVTFDCQGNSITGNSTGNGVYLYGRAGVAIKNCVMINHGSEFSSAGSSSNTVVTNMTLNSSGFANVVNFTYSGDMTVGSAAAQADSGLMNVSKYFAVSGTATWVYINVSYTGDTNEDKLRMYKWTGSSWTLVSGTNGVNTANNFVYANLTSFSVFALMADVTAPIVSLSTPVAGANASTLSPNFIFNFTDAFSATAACTLNVDGVAAAPENSSTLNDTMTTIAGTLAPGLHQWNVTCLDSMGNNGSSVNRSIMIDIFYPVVTATTPLEGTNTSSTTPPFNFTVIEDTGAWLSCNLNVDGAVNATNASTLNDTLTSIVGIGFTQGVHTWNVTCSDPAGNVNSTANRTILVDTAAPSITPSAPANFLNTTTATPSFVFTVTDNFGAWTSCLLNVNGTTIGNNASVLNNTATTIVAPGLTEGTYTWNVTCTDPAGNGGSSANWTVTVDLVPPVINSVYLNESDLYISATSPNNGITLMVNAADNASGIAYLTANFSLLNQSSTLVNMTSLGGGLYNATINVTDVTGMNFLPVNITVFGYDNSGRAAVGQSFVTVILYNATTPAASNPCMQWDAITTNLSTVTNFSGVNYILAEKLNLSCLGIVGPYAWMSTYERLLLINFTSVNMSNPAIGSQLAALATAIEVNITAPNQFGDSRIYLNSTALAAFNTTSVVTLYHLPFSSQPNVTADLDAAGPASSLVWVQGVGEGNLTFNVAGFSGYNASDIYGPTIVVNAPTNGSTIYYPSAIVNLTLNGTGTQISLAVVLLDSIGFVYNATTGTITSNTANCSNVTQGSELFTCYFNSTVLANGNHTLNITVYDLGGATGRTNNSVIWFVTAADTQSPVFNTATLNDTYFTTGKPVWVSINATDNTNVASVTANSVALNHTGGVNESWNGTIVLTGSSGPGAVTVVATDSVGNFNTTLLNYTMDNTAPVITLVAPTNAATVFSNDGNVTVTWTVTEGNLTLTNVSIDNGVFFNTSTSNGTVSFNYTGMIAGNHSLVIRAVDYYGFAAVVSNTTFIMDRPINTTQQLGAMQSAIGNSTLTAVELFDSTGYNQTANESLNASNALRLGMTVNATTVNVTVDIQSFNGTSANWNNTAAFAINTNPAGTVGAAVALASGSSITAIVQFTNMSAFLPDSAYLNGTKIVFLQALGSLDVLYIADDVGGTVYKLSSCAGSVPPSTVTLATMCYINTSSNVTIYVPHLSGAALSNDDAAPTVTITVPTNNSIRADSNFTLAFTASEANPRLSNQFCRYNVTNGAGQYLSLAGFLTTPSPSGLTYSFTQAITGLVNGSYNVTVNCTDLNNQSRQVYYNFTVADSTAPTASATSSVSGSTVTITATTSETAECRYATIDVAYSSMNSTFTTTNATSHSVTVSSLANGAYTYYVRCSDANSNAMASSTAVAFTISVSTGGGDTTSCTPNWSCTSFGACSATGAQTRTCTDVNSCGTVSGKPVEVSQCIPAGPCTESWTCVEYGPCSSAGYSTRVCADGNRCGTQVSRPVELKTCNYTVPVTVPATEVTAIAGGAEVTIASAEAGTSVSAVMPLQAVIDTGVSGMVLSAKNALADVKVTVKSVAAKPASIETPEGTVIKYLEITAANIKSGDLDKATIKFEIAKGKVQSITRIRLMRYVSGSWVKLTTMYAGESNGNYKFEAETPGFSYFAVIEEPAPAYVPDGEQPPLISPPAGKAVDYTILYVAIVIVVIGVAYYMWSRQPSQPKWKSR